MTGFSKKARDASGMGGNLPMNSPFRHDVSHQIAVERQSAPHGNFYVCTEK
jgi:hypothetical protein